MRNINFTMQWFYCKFQMKLYAYMCTSIYTQTRTKYIKINIHDVYFIFNLYLQISLSFPLII